MSNIMKFSREFKAYSTGLSSKITVETDAVSLDEVLEEFTNFLKGCGYVFDGEVTIQDSNE